MHNALFSHFYLVAIPFKTGSLFKFNPHSKRVGHDLSQSPSKPGHYSNYWPTTSPRSRLSQSPSKPGHYSNPVVFLLVQSIWRRNPLQNRVTIQIGTIEFVAEDTGSRNPLQNRVTIQMPVFLVVSISTVAIPFKTGSLFKWKTGKRPDQIASQSPSKPGHYSNLVKLLCIWVRPSQSPSKPGHYSNPYPNF